MNALWEEIREEYDQARNALWCHKGAKSAGTWSRDEDLGRYHLWNAYHKAKSASDKDELTYARILATMATEATRYMSKYGQFNKFVKPSFEAYKRAEKAGLNPSQKELNLITDLYESLNYEFKSKKTPYEEMIKNIKGYEQFGTFQFHDSSPLHFEHNEDTALLTLRFDITVKFRFDGVFSIETHCFHEDSYVYDFYCYPCLRGQNALVFDVDLYKITCSSICVESVNR